MPDAGIEPAILRSLAWRSNQLSYAAAVTVTGDFTFFSCRYYALDQLHNVIDFAGANLDQSALVDLNPKCSCAKI